MYARAYLELGATYREEGKTGYANQNYARAFLYAGKAIELSGKTPLTEAEWHDPRTGFNDGSANNSWIWGLTLSAENASNIITNVAHLAPEAVWGYSVLSLPSVGKAMYDRISYADFRKKSWLDPENTWNPSSENYDPAHGYQFCGADDALSGFETHGIYNAYEYFMAFTSPYVNIKFRPANGQCVEYTEGNCADHVLMRVEEMYFIQVEAAAGMSSTTAVKFLGEMKSVTAGLDEAKKLLNSFMRTYRYSTYDCSRFSSYTLFIQEMLFQKRVEFWGEGVLFYDYKRLGRGITRGYPGTNESAIFALNSEGPSPQWNIVVTNAEFQYNSAIITSTNNPDPSGLLTLWVGE
jgi:hypothetical protein